MLSRQILEVGAVCVSSARTDLCGGCRVTGIPTAALYRFFIETKLIGQGYGQAMWNHCITSAKDKGWADFIFWSDASAQPFYEHLGAIKIEEHPSIAMPGRVVPIMKYCL